MAHDMKTPCKAVLAVCGGVLLLGVCDAQAQSTTKTSPAQVGPGRVVITPGAKRPPRPPFGTNVKKPSKKEPRFDW